MAVTTTNLGVITAYGDAVAAGYTGTKAEWQTLMASYATVGQQAVDAKNAAVDAKNAAVQAKDTAVAAKDTATSKATEATKAANTATTKANEASASAQSIAQSASQITQNTSDISELKEDLTTTASKEDMLKSFPTDTASGSVASFADGANVPVKSLIVNIDPVQEGSGDPSPTNVRPISGWSEVNVNACGVNIWDEQWESGLISVSNGQNITGSGIRSKNYSPCTPSTEYRFVFGSGTTKYVFWYDADHNYISNNAVTDIIIRFTSPPNAKYFKLRADTIATYNNDFSANYPSTDTDYYPYSGQSITISLGQTVYGGTLDVLSGELVIDRAMQELDGSGTIAMGYAGSGDAAFRYFQWGNDYAVDTNAWETDVIANFLVTIKNGRGARVQYNAAKSPRIIVPESGSLFETVEDLKAYLNETHLTIVYPLATPITVTLTPHEVRSLLGSNNVWADCGDTEVIYRADPTLYISRLTEPDADMVADANIVSGQYFMVGNTLYKATANIASGATISPNVNCTRKSLSEALNELNA